MEEDLRAPSFLVIIPRDEADIRDPEAVMDRLEEEVTGLVVGMTFGADARAGPRTGTRGTGGPPACCPFTPRRRT